MRISSKNPVAMGSTGQPAIHCSKCLPMRDRDV